MTISQKKILRPQRILAVAAILGMTVFSRANAAPIILSFEDIPGMGNLAGTPIPPASQLSNQYQPIYGVSFSSGSSYVGVLWMNPGDAPSGSNVVGGSTLSGNLTFSSNYPIVATFTDPNNPSVLATTDFVSLQVDRFSAVARTLTLNAFDINGNLIATYTVPDLGGPTLHVSVPGIHSVQFIGTVDSDGAAIDNFTFDPVVPIPEPSMAALALIGGAVLFLRGRRLC